MLVVLAIWVTIMRGLRINYKHIHRIHKTSMAVSCTENLAKGQIDHINGIKTDNRLCNLREATRSQNQVNTPVVKNNTSGFKGVHLHNKTSNRLGVMHWYKRQRIHT